VALGKFGFLSRNRGFAFALPERLLDCPPRKHRALHALRKFANPSHHEKITELFRRIVFFRRYQIVKCAEHFFDFLPALAFQFRRHQRRGRLTDGATVSGKLDFPQPAVAVEFHGEMNFVAARRIIAMDAHGSVRQLAEIPRPPRVIEDHFLVKFFKIAEFRVHLKKRTAF